MQIGSHTIDGQVVVAPMAGVADQPFRNLARQAGAALAISEMVSVDPSLRATSKSQWRHRHDGENGICSVQIVGTEPEIMAAGAKYNEQLGAQMIDINMGCPAKKVCKKAAGSALMKDETLVAEILSSVVNAVDVPVTLKIRTGWSPEERNAVRIAEIAQEQGVQALTVHGRTRACAFRGEAEYDTIAAVKQAVELPVIANGDIDSSEKARYVLDVTQADAIMIGRAAQGNPWLITEIDAALRGQQKAEPPCELEILSTMKAHLLDMHQFYGELASVRIARKHLGWYCGHLSSGKELKTRLNQAQTPVEQIELLDNAMQLAERNDIGEAA